MHSYLRLDKGTYSHKNLEFLALKDQIA